MKRLTGLLFAAALMIPFAVTAQSGTEKGPGMGGCCMGPGGVPMAPRHGMRMKHGERGDMRMEMAAKLEMTEEQKTKMEKLQTDFQLLMVDQQAKVRKAQIQLRQLMRDDKAAVTAVETQIDQMAKLRAEAAKMRYRHHAEMQSVLTDKQKEMLKEIRKEHPGGRHGMMFPGDVDGDEDAPEPDGEEG
jgi:Spy/CpxP family protein refolding chaperone